MSWTMARRYTLEPETLLYRMVLVTPGATKVRSLAASLYASSVLAASDCRLVLEYKLVDHRLILRLESVLIKWISHTFQLIADEPKLQISCYDICK